MAAPNTKIFIITLMALSVIGGLFYFSNRGIDKPTEIQVSQNIEAVSEDMPANQNESVKGVPEENVTESGIDNSLGNVDGFLDVPPESPEMIEWREKAYVLSMDEHNGYAGKNIGELRVLVNGGDIKAAEWLGNKLAFSGQGEEAVIVMKDAASRGSIGSARALAILYTGTAKDSIPADKFKAHAWFSVARSMGDVESVLTGGLGIGMTQEEKVLAELEYVALLAELHEMALENIGMPLPFNPEPFKWGKE